MPSGNERREVTEVEIFGSTLSLVSLEGETYTREIAAYVDARMNVIASEHNLADTGKIAIMTALDIADTILRARQARADELQRTQRVAERLARCVDDGPRAPEA